MSSAPARGYLTAWLKATLEAEDLLVGTVIAPTAGGWNDDPQQEGNWYAQYIVIVPQTASEGTGSMADAGTEWNLPFSLTSYGVSALQVEGQADTARRIVNEIRRAPVELDGVGWRVMDIKTNSIGSVDINRATDPPELSQRDVVMIRLSKER